MPRDCGGVDSGQGLSRPYDVRMGPVLSRVRPCESQGLSRTRAHGRDPASGPDAAASLQFRARPAVRLSFAAGTAGTDGDVRRGLSPIPMSDEPAVTPDPLPAPIVVEKGVGGTGCCGKRFRLRDGSGGFRRCCLWCSVLNWGCFCWYIRGADAWADNYFSVAVPDSALSTWRTLWNNPYVRGGVSGLGLVNVWIAVAEVFRMFAARGQAGH
jgi:hypothetical protein